MIPIRTRARRPQWGQSSGGASTCSMIRTVSGEEHTNGHSLHGRLRIQGESAEGEASRAELGLFWPSLLLVELSRIYEMPGMS